MIFLLEDDPLRVDWFRSKFPHDRDNLIVSRSVESARYQFRGLRPDMVFLDHDLEITAGEEYDEARHSGQGFLNHVLCHELEYPGLRKAQRIVIHSVNPDGAAAMAAALRVAGIACELIPFPSLQGRLKVEKSR